MGIRLGAAARQFPNPYVTSEGALLFQNKAPTNKFWWRDIDDRLLDARGKRDTWAGWGEEGYINGMSRTHSHESRLALAAVRLVRKHFESGGDGELLLSEARFIRPAWVKASKVMRFIGEEYYPGFKWAVERMVKAAMKWNSTR